MEGLGVGLKEDIMGDCVVGAEDGEIEVGAMIGETVLGTKDVGDEEETGDGDDGEPEVGAGERVVGPEEVGEADVVVIRSTQVPFAETTFCIVYQGRMKKQSRIIRHASTAIRRLSFTKLCTFDTRLGSRDHSLVL